MIDRRIGYVRVSAFDQNPERQLENLKLDKVFTDNASGKDIQRPALAALLDFVRDGDIVVVQSMDRLARNLDDLRRLVRGPGAGVRHQSRDTVSISAATRIAYGKPVRRFI